MAISVRKAASYEDVLQAPENMIAELLDGELHLQPRPRRRHTRIASFLGAALHNAFESGSQIGPGGWFIFDEPELHLGLRPDILVPDIAAWRAATFSEDIESDDAFFLRHPTSPVKFFQTELRVMIA
jgi:Uma2 family endonuclease